MRLNVTRIVLTGALALFLMVDLTLAQSGTRGVAAPSISAPSFSGPSITAPSVDFSGINTGAIGNFGAPVNSGPIFNGPVNGGQIFNSGGVLGSGIVGQTTDSFSPSGGGLNAGAYNFRPPTVPGCCGDTRQSPYLPSPNIPSYGAGYCFGRAYGRPLFKPWSGF